MAQVNPIAIPVNPVNPAIANLNVAGPAPPTTLATLFAQMPDVYNGVYTGLLAQYSHTTADTSEALAASTKRFPTTVPNVFIYLDSDGVIKTVSQIHGTEAIIGQVGPWDQSTFAFNSDVVHGQVGTVLLPNATFFATIDNIQVPTVAHMDVALAALAVDVHVAGPFVAGEADTEIISSRRAIPVPHVYVPLVYNRTHTPREAWTQLGGQIVADNRTVDCQVLLNFLRAAASLPRLVPLATVSSVALRAALVAPIVDAGYLEHQHRYMTRLFPALTPPDGQVFLQQQLAQTHFAIQANLQAQTTAQQAAAELAAAGPATKTFTVAYPAIGLSLRKLCDAGEDDDALPEFWKIFAAAQGKKQQCFPALEALLVARANDETSPSVLPILVAKMYDNLAHFKIGNHNVDEIPLGLSPFMICPIGYSKADNQVQLNALYLSIHEEGGSASLDELKKLLPSTFNLPADLSQLTEFIGCYSITVDVILGEFSPLAVALRDHYKFIVNNLHVIRSSVKGSDHLMLMFRILRHIQIISLSYINLKLNLKVPYVPDPSFAPIESNITMRMFNIFPVIPQRYTAEMYPAAGLPPREPAGKGNSPNAAPGGGAAPVLKKKQPANNPNNQQVGGAAANPEDRIEAPVNDQNSAWLQAFRASDQKIDWGNCLRKRGRKPILLVKCFPPKPP